MSSGTNPSIGARRMAGSPTAAGRFNLPQFPLIQEICPVLFAKNRSELLALDRAFQDWRAQSERSIGDAIVQLQSKSITP